MPTRWITRALARTQWQRSGYAALPRVEVAEDPEIQRWQVVAGGLALVLSRLTRTERATRFAASDRLYRYVGQRLERGKPVLVAPELLGEVMHELAEIADPLTTRCLRACFNASLRAHPDAAGPDSIAGGRSTGVLQSQPRPDDFSFSATLPTTGPRTALAGKR